MMPILWSQERGLGSKGAGLQPNEAMGAAQMGAVRQLHPAMVSIRSMYKRRMKGSEEAWWYGSHDKNSEWRQGNFRVACGYTAMVSKAVDGLGLVHVSHQTMLLQQEKQKQKRIGDTHAAIPPACSIIRWPCLMRQLVTLLRT